MKENLEGMERKQYMKIAWINIKDMDTIIASLNKILDSKKKLLVLHKGMSVNPNIPILKTFTYTLYYITPLGTVVVLSESYKGKVKRDDMTDSWSRYNEMFTLKLLRWVTDGYFNKLRDGTE